MNLRNFTPPKGTLAPQRELTLNERKAAGRANFADYAVWQIVRQARMSATDSVKVKVREYGWVALVEFKNDTLRVTRDGRTNVYQSSEQVKVARLQRNGWLIAIHARSLGFSSCSRSKYTTLIRSS
jgi:hypothetical protein